MRRRGGVPPPGDGEPVPYARIFIFRWDIILAQTIEKDGLCEMKGAKGTVAPEGVYTSKSATPDGVASAFTQSDTDVFRSPW